MKDSLARKVPIPKAARRKVYFDTQPIKQNEAEINFFPAVATKKRYKDNYISNPFPGDNARLVYGLTFALTSQFLQTDAANNIDAEKIINQTVDSSVIISADQNYTQFMRLPVGHHFNFEGTKLNIALAFAGQAAAADSEQTVSKTVTIQEDAIQKVADPFVIAPNQVLSLKVKFNDASDFPADSDWTASGQPALHLQCRLNVAELTPAMQ
jgi:hypothetical protein